MEPTYTDLIEELAGVVPEEARTTGTRIQAAGSVHLENATPRLVRATVRDAEPREVTLAREGRRLTMGCSCADFAKFGPCKHLWAVALEVAQGALPSAAVPERLPDAVVRARSLGRGEARSGPGQASDSSGSFGSFTGGLLDERGLDGGDHEDDWEAEGDPGLELVYVLDVERSVRSGGLALELRATDPRRSGGVYGGHRARPYDPRAVGAAVPVDPLDRRFVPVLAEAAGEQPFLAGELAPGSRPLLPPTLARLWIPELCATGRLLWTDRTREGGPLELDRGAAWSVRAAVRPAGELPPEESGRDGGKAAKDSGGGEPRELALWLERDGERLELERVQALLPFGWLLVEGRLAPLEARGALALARDLRARGPLRFRAGDQPAVLAGVAETPGIDPALVAELAPVEADPPVPRLHVETGGRIRRRVLGCTIEHDYAGVLVEPRDPRSVLAVSGGERLLRRDREAERRAEEQFLAQGGRHSTAASWHEAPGAVDASRFPALVRGLLALGWVVEADDRRWRAPGQMSMSVASGIDWFELQGTVRFGEQVASLPELLAAARAGRDTVRLGDGSIGMLPERWLERWRLLELGQAEGERVRFRQSQAFLIDALLARREQEVEAEIDSDPGFRLLRERLRDFERIEPAPEPPGFHGELRPYQREGLGWLGFLSSLGLGGCLADDMGLGKTVQLLAFLQARRAAHGAGPRRPSLVVAPRSLVFNWIDEAARFTPDLEVLDYTGPGRGALRRRLARCDLIVTTYGTLRRDADFFSALELDCAVLDEAQAIKNAASLTARAARLLRARQRLALSGTPIENHLGELWSLFEFLNPGMLGRAGTFAELAGRGSADPDLQALSLALRPFFLRRRKEEVLDDLPPKTEQVLLCTLGKQERRRYDELREHYRASLLARESEVGLGRMKIHVLEALLRLRQAALHPGLIDDQRTDEGSAKLDALLPRLAAAAESGKKALVFSQFTGLLSIVRKRLDTAGIPYEYLDGRTRDRKQRVERFQTDAAVPLFLISLKAGGQGLNLTAADYVFLLDPWWNPAVEAQAVDRAHRIGRERPVMAYRLIARGTIEERVQELQASKRAMASALFGESAGGLAGLTRADLESLFAA